MNKGPGDAPGPLVLVGEDGSLVHTVHAAAAVVVAAAARCFLLLGDLGDDGLSGEKQAADGGCVL